MPGSLACREIVLQSVDVVKMVIMTWSQLLMYPTVGTYPGNAGLAQIAVLWMGPESPPVSCTFCGEVEKSAYLGSYFGWATYYPQDLGKSHGLCESCLLSSEMGIATPALSTSKGCCGNKKMRHMKMFQVVKLIVVGVKWLRRCEARLLNISR